VTREPLDGAGGVEAPYHLMSEPSTAMQAGIILLWTKPGSFSFRETIVRGDRRSRGAKSVLSSSLAAVVSQPKGFSGTMNNTHGLNRGGRGVQSPADSL
jgi:hypothetical protein